MAKLGLNIPVLGTEGWPGQGVCQVAWPPVALMCNVSCRGPASQVMVCAYCGLNRLVLVLLIVQEDGRPRGQIAVSYEYGPLCF